MEGPHKLPTAELEPARIIGMLRLVHTSTVVDILEQHHFHGAVDNRIRPLVHGDTRLVGRAQTLKKAAYHPEAPQAKDSPSHHFFPLLDLATPGDVIVIDASSIPNAASWGGLLGRVARMRGIGGAVIDGAVRDLADLRAIGLPVYATNLTTLSGHHRLMSLAMNVEIECGGVPVHPGDYIVADEDGVAVVPARMAPFVADALKAEQRELAIGAFIEETGDYVEAVKRFGSE